MDPFTETLRSWHDFFMLAGGSAATLMGLVFVGASLGGNVKRTSMRALQTFVSPMVQQFGHVLLVAAVLVVPTHRPWTLALGCGGLSLFMLLNALAVLKGLVVHRRGAALSRNKWVWHFGVPFFAALAGVVASGVVLGGASWALGVIAASSATFLVVGIRNSWTLVVWILDNRAPETEVEAERG
jgi:hypothetical protein